LSEGEKEKPVLYRCKLCGSNYLVDVILDHIRQDHRVTADIEFIRTIIEVEARGYFASEKIDSLLKIIEGG